MSKMTSITLDDHSAEFLAAQVASGRFGSASEVMAEALRVLERRDAALAELRAEIQKGEDSGFQEVPDLDGFFDELSIEALG